MKKKLKPLPIKLTDYQIQILIGSLLGDGNLQLDRKNRSKNARLTIRRSQKDNGYLLWEYLIFQNLTKDNSVHYENQYHKKAKKHYETVYFLTRAAEVLTPYYDKWYPNNKKIIPRDLELTPLILMIWFLDDGHYFDGVMKFSTHGFGKKDVEFLKKLLEEKYQEYFFISYDNDLPILFAGTKATIKIMNDIKSLVPNCMKRKLIKLNQ